MKFILASASPRRINLLQKWQFDFVPVNPQYDEKIFTYNPAVTAMLNAYNKAFSTHKKYKNSIVVGADTIVVINNKILGKPKNKSELKKMLQLLSENVHRVITGIAIIKKEKFMIDFIETKVKFKKLSCSEIKTYIATGEGLDKAGGYAIQGAASSFVEGIDGPIDNVIGIPINLLKKLLKN